MKLTEVNVFSRQSIRYYDEIYSAQGKDYEQESAYLMKVLARYKVPNKATMLDVACGTGRHIAHLQKRFNVEGVDISLDFLRLAKKRNPAAVFHHGDMLTFSLGRKFDVITCLFSSIGYMRSMADLTRAVRNMAGHLKEGGILLIEPWLSPEQWHVGRVAMSIVDQPELKIVRMNSTARRGRISVFEMHYLVGKPDGVRHFSELHQARLSTIAEMKRVYQRCGLTVEHDPKGPSGRGLYIGTAGGHGSRRG
jgi:SAM-dependent methyltransferase